MCLLVLAGLELIFFVGAGRMGVWSSRVGLTPNIQLLWDVCNSFSTGIAPIKDESSHSFECLSNLEQQMQLKYCPKGLRMIMG